MEEVEGRGGRGGLMTGYATIMGVMRNVVVFELPLAELILLSFSVPIGCPRPEDVESARVIAHVGPNSENE